VDDYAPLRRTLARYLEGEDYLVVAAESGEDALSLLQNQTVDLALIDMVLPGMGGMDLLSAIIDSYNLPVILMTGFAEADSAMEAVRRGAYEFLTKPVVPELLPVLIENALDHRRLEQQARLRPGTQGVYGNLIGESPAMQEVFQAIEKVATTHAPVLITGETGTGKNLVAREIHSRSKRHSGPFLQINCAAIPEQLFESELFGHEKGAFTDAQTRHLGRFERARGGTLLLDEIACLPLNLQAKLLRVLEEGEFERVGGRDTLESDVRILAATNVDLTKLIAEGKFRHDLFYRLATFPIHLPPLRERSEDIPLLLRRFLDEHAEGSRQDIPGVTKEAVTEARLHPWPGNIRELANAVAHAVISCGEESISSLLPPFHLQISPVSPRTSPTMGLGQEERPLGTSRERVPLTLEDLLTQTFQESTTAFHHFYLKHMLERFDGNRHLLAKHCKIHPRTLHRHLKRLGLD
jgi:DNA-binding NtrC family response regulator